MSAKITIEYTDETELQAILQRLQPVIGRVKRPLKGGKSVYRRAHVKVKNIPQSPETPTI